jgi:hypothetical protein
MFRKSLVALAVLTVVVSALAFAGAPAAKADDVANAKLCLNGGWRNLMRSNATQFPSQFHCVQYSVFGGVIYALAKIHVEPCATQPADGLCVSTSGFGLQPTSFLTTPLLKNGVEVLSEFLIVPANGEVNGSPFGFIGAPCVAGNVYSATATGTSADSLSTPTAPGIPVTSNTVTRTSSCP